MNAGRASQLTGRLRLRGLQSATEIDGHEMQQEAARFERLKNPDSAPRVVSSFNLFQTPEPLADKVAGLLADGRELGTCLEPSAGLGRLYKALRKLDSLCPVTLIDVSAECTGELVRACGDDRDCLVLQKDFLTWSGEIFDSILMNPPFKMGADIKHILHARNMLSKDGGRLVSLCANGPKQQAALRPIATQWIELPAGSFKESYTNVSAAIFVFDFV